MSAQWIKPDAVFDGQDMHVDRGVCIHNGTITDIAPAPKNARAISGTITPGFIDLQVNGGGGVMFNATPTSDGLCDIAQAHRDFGTVAILPTVITDQPNILDAAASALMANKNPAILGLHIEGPHIALAKRGTHASDYIRPLDARTMDVVARLLTHNITVMITLAPEAATLDQIAHLSRMGAIVSLGHTDTAADQIGAAVKAGARCGTHLFNAMSQMTGREAGAVGALINSHCYVGIICDGHHVGDDMIALAIRARPAPDLMFLVSDAMATIGGPDAFDLYGQTITLKDGKLINSEGSLAGAHITQHQGVHRLVDHVGLNLEAALRMAISTPAACIGRPDLTALIGRDLRDCLLLSPDLGDARPLTDAL